MSYYGRNVSSNSTTNINAIDDEAFYFNQNKLHLVCNSVELYKQQILANDFAKMNDSFLYNEHKLYNAEEDYMFVVKGLPFEAFERRGFDSSQAVKFTAKYLTEKWNGYCVVNGNKTKRKGKSDLLDFFNELGYENIEVVSLAKIPVNTLMCRTFLFFATNKERFLSLESVKDKLPLIALGDSELPTYYYRGNVRIVVDLTDLKFSMGKNGQMKQYVLGKQNGANFYAEGKYKPFLQQLFMDYRYMLICDERTESKRMFNDPQRVLFFKSESDFAEFVVNQQKQNYKINIL